MLELIYETHSVTTHNESGHAAGWLPGELSAAGREQAVLPGERRRDVDAVFSSDLGRALAVSHAATRWALQTTATCLKAGRRGA